MYENVLKMCQTYIAFLKKISLPLSSSDPKVPSQLSVREWRDRGKKRTEKERGEEVSRSTLLIILAKPA